MSIKHFLHTLFAPCVATLAVVNLTSCASESESQESRVLSQQLEEVADAGAPDRATVAAMAYLDQVQWLDPEVRQRMDDATLETILDYLEDQIPSQEVVTTVRHHNDTIDCIPWAAQKSVRNLRAAGIEVDEQLVAPSTLVEQESQASKDETAAREQSGESEQPLLGEESVAPPQPILCPKGTIAMRRIPLSEIAAYGSLEGYIRRPPPATQLHEHIAVERNVTNYGNEGYINIWKPAVPTGDFSLMQLWSKRGSGANLETVELGIIRWGSDTDTRLFIFTTNAAYDPNIADSTCWNTECGAFVQTDNTYALSQAMTPYSVSSGDQYSKYFKLHKDGNSGHWWVMVGSTWVGYWPRTWFDSNGIRDYAATVQWGAEVYDDSGTYHTPADMGDGRFAGWGFGNAAYIRKMRFITSISGGVIYWSEASGASWVGSADSRCYDGSLNYSSGSDWKNYLYAGGPGYNWVTGGDPALLCRY